MRIKARNDPKTVPLTSGARKGIYTTETNDDLALAYAQNDLGQREKNDRQLLLSRAGPVGGGVLQRG